MTRKPCTPLKVTAHLKDGRINSADGIIMLDSIVYHGWFAKYAPNVLRGEASQDYNQRYIGLPFVSLSDNRWAASKGIYTELSVSVEHYNKRPDFFTADKISKLKQDKGIISDSIGPYRAYRKPNIIRTVKDGIITFYAKGHKAPIEELLFYIPAICKKASMGWGIIDKWIVEEIDEDYSTWHPEHGLMRPVTIDEAKQLKLDMTGYPIFEYGIKPPYWKPSNTRLCYVPVAGRGGQTDA